MRLLLPTTALVSALILSVAPDLVFQREALLRLAFFLLILALLAGSLVWILLVEHWATRVTGHGIPVARRVLIPAPVLLAFAMIVKLVVMPFGGYGTDGHVVFYQNATLVAIGILPFLITEDVPAPLRFIFKVWGSFAVWAAIFLLAWALAFRAPQ